MAETTVPNTIILVDDEPHNIYWIVEYIESLKMKVRLHTNLNDALEDLQKEIYRAAVIDLNIPALEPLDAELRNSGSLYARFPGLYAARFARNKGYRDRQVILYSVHQDPEVTEEAERLRCTYLMKGRPKSFKEELKNVLSFDPTDQL